METGSDTSTLGCSIILLIVFAIISAIVGAFIGYTSHNFIVMVIILGVIALLGIIIGILQLILS